MRADAAPKSPQLERTDWWLAAAVFAVALTVRLVFLFTSPDRGWPHSVFYEGDAPTWVTWANALDRGEPFEFNLPLRSPAVAYLISWIHPGVLEPPFTAFKALWCLFTSLAAALMYLAIRLQFARRISLIVVCLYTFSFGSYIISTSLNNEAMYTMTLMAIVAATLRVTRQPSLWLAAALAALHGVAMLIRFEHLLLWLMTTACLAWTFFRQSKPGQSAAPAQVDNDRLHSKHVFVALVILIFGPILVCLPWSIHGSLATQRFNTIASTPTNYEQVGLPWTEDARQFLESLPAFTRADSVRAATYYNTVMGRMEITAADVRGFFLDVYGYVPEPLPSFALLSIKGPLDFALANHSASPGGFSKAALAGPGEADPTIAFGRPDHLRLFNHGYAVGWSSIKSDFRDWLKLVSAKLAIFFDGATLGFTSRNLPLGLKGVRRPIDLFVADRDLIWQISVLALLLGGVLLCIARKQGGIWLLIILYKLIVTVLFYGYARQAVSILPAFFLLMAMSVDQIATWIGSLWKPTRRTVSIAAVAALLAVLAIDISGSVWRSYLSISGPLRFAPHWGNDAFESHETLHIKPSESGP